MINEAIPLQGIKKLKWREPTCGGIDIHGGFDCRLDAKSGVT